MELGFIGDASIQSVAIHATIWAASELHLGYIWDYIWDRWRA